MSEIPAALRRKRPPQWRQINFPKRGVYRLSPNPRLPGRRRAVELWDRARFVIRSSSLWAVAAVCLYFGGYGIAASIAALLSFAFFLFRPQVKPLALHLDDEFGTDSAEFLSTLAGATGVPILGGNRIKIYNNGDEFYPAMLDAIGRAEYSVTMEQYIFATSGIARRFARVFADRARAGVSVKLLLDAVGSGALSGEIIATLRDAGCEIAWFHPIRWYNLHRVNNRNHRKSIITDGRVAFTGGAGIDDHWLGDARSPKEWRDVHLRLEGPAVAPLQSGFAANWLQTTGEVITGPRYYPVLDAKGGVDVQTVTSSPKGDFYTASILYHLAIRCSRQCLYITNPYFVPSNEVIGLLEDAVDRGVDVKVILAGRHCDTWWARMNSLRLYGRLLDAGVSLYEYEPAMIHQKTMIVDRIWATIGTTNFDHRSFQLNEESNVCFYDPRLVSQLHEVFLRDLAKCTRIDRDSWNRRAFLQRAGEVFASLLQDQV